MVKVIWTIPALENLDEIADYIALDKPEAAKKFVQKVFKKVEKLSYFPDLGNKPEELKGASYRRVVVAPALIYYRKEKENILIIHVRRGEKNFSLEAIEGNEM